MRLRVFHHPVNLILGQLRGTGNGNFLFLARLFVLRGDSQDTIGVDVKSDLHLGRASLGQL